MREKLFNAGAELMAAGGRLSVKGSSMEPTILDGQAVRVEPVKSREIIFGDIIAYSTGESIKVHRFLFRRASRKIVTMGDSLGDFDPPVPISRILGRVTEIIRDGRRTKIRRASSVFRGGVNLARASVRKLFRIFLVSGKPS